MFVAYPASYFKFSVMGGRVKVEECDSYKECEAVHDSMCEYPLQIHDVNSIHNRMQECGDYCLAFSEGKFMTDCLGSRPIFLAENGAFTIISNRYPTGYANVKLLPGSSLLRLEKNTLKEERVDSSYTRSDFISLEEALVESVKRRVSGRERVAVAFSGGLDSSLLSYLAKRFCRVHLFTIISKGEMDDKAERAAELLDLPIEYVKADERTVKDVYEKSRSKELWKSPMDFSIAIGFTLLSTSAHLEGHETLLAGQGADELFGGYSKYVRLQHEPSSLLEMLEKDVNNLYAGAARDAEAIREGHCKPSFPYMDYFVACVAKQLPLERKVFGAQRKVRLRLAARELGLHEDICGAEKKAFQYSSGLQKLVNRIFF